MDTHRLHGQVVQGYFSVLELFGIAVLPWLVFLFSISLFAVAYHKSKRIVLGLILLGVAISASQARRAQLLRMQGRFHLAAQCAGALCLALVVGLSANDCCLARYWTSNGSHSYANVLPSEAAAGYADAGKIVFADEARLHTHNAMGYKDISIYCVVPIGDDSQPVWATPLPVQFWAAGVGCCGVRGGFVCDDAWDPRARSGLVILERDWHPQFASAVAQAEAAFNISSAKDPVFVRWVVDPELVELNFWRFGVGILLVASLLHLLLSMVAAWIINGMAKGGRGEV